MPVRPCGVFYPVVGTSHGPRYILATSLLSAGLWYRSIFIRLFFVVWDYLYQNIIKCSIQGIYLIFKQQILSTNFSQFVQLKKKVNFILVQTGFFSVLDQWKVYFLFQLIKLRKIRGKNWGKQNWLFDVTNKNDYCTDVINSRSDWIHVGIAGWKQSLIKIELYKLILSAFLLKYQQWRYLTTKMDWSEQERKSVFFCFLYSTSNIMI